MKKLVALGAVMTAVTAFTFMASTRGYGVPRPIKKPVSIREASAKSLGSGRRGTRYFIGGGFHRGK